MTKKVRVGVLAKTFVEWSGGVDFIIYLTNALAESDSLDIYFLIPDTNDALHLYDTDPALYKPNGIMQRFKKIKPREYANPAAPQLDSLNRRVYIQYYRNTEDGFFSCVNSLKLDILLPTTETFGDNFPLPWIGYIWDFQHRHLPQYFSKDELKGRDKIFLQTITQAPMVLVNSKQARLDIEKYFPKAYKPKRVTSLPFAPSPNPDWLTIDTDVLRKKYKVKNNYFIVCNQFWMHKSHLTAIKAFAKVAKTNPGISLVCTGKMEEPRNPGYIDEIHRTVKKLGIEKQVQFLGFIPKEDQIGLLRGAIALVQPTLYEGGPGGGAAYNAAALRVPIIASDIPVNLEIAGNDIVFFKAGSAEELAKKMKQAIATKLVKHHNKELMVQGSQNLKALSKVMSDMIMATMKEFKC